MIFKRFKVFITEESLDQGKIKLINKELFNAVKSADADDDINKIMQPIVAICANYGIEIPESTKVIINKSEQRFPVRPFDNVVLVVRWHETDDKFQLVDASLQGK